MNTLQGTQSKCPVLGGRKFGLQQRSRHATCTFKFVGDVAHPSLYCSEAEGLIFLPPLGALLEPGQALTCRRPVRGQSQNR